MSFPKVKKNLEIGLQDALDNYIRENSFLGAAVSIQSNTGNTFSWHGAAGNLSASSSYFLTEVSELFITAILLKLMVRGKLRLDDKLTRFLPEDEVEALALWKDDERSKKITIDSLLSHLSGIPDFLKIRDKTGQSIWDQLISGNDQHWSNLYELKKLCHVKPDFPSGARRKPRYSFTDFFLLVRIIERIEGKSFGAVIQELHYRPLGLSQTYIYENHLDRTPSFFQNEQNTLLIPLGMSCLGPSGGMVSTSKDCMVFLRAFFHGHLFPSEYLGDIQRWMPLGKGLFQGIGIQKIEAGGMARLFTSSQPLLGIVGRAGAFALYHTEKKLFFTGTINHINREHQVLKLVNGMSRLINLS